VGLAFKPRTDDVRRAPSLKIMEDLFLNGAKVQAYDPVAAEKCQRVLSCALRSLRFGSGSSGGRRRLVNRDGMAGVPCLELKDFETKNEDRADLRRPQYFLIRLK